jgi:hypothetical protein
MEWMAVPFIEGGESVICTELLGLGMPQEEVRKALRVGNLGVEARRTRTREEGRLTTEGMCDALTAGFDQDRSRLVGP